MIRALVEQTFDQQKKYFVLAGSSSDVKPTAGLITGSEFHEVDTGTKYEFDEASSTWNAVGLSPEDIKAEIDAWLDEHPEATTTVQDGAITYAKLDASLQGKIDDVGELQTDVSSLKSAVENDCAMNDGTYPDLTSGNAEQLLSTTGVTDKVPYLFRPSAGDGADREQDKIVGGTVAWNQLSKNDAVSKTYNDLTITNNGDGSFTISGTANADSLIQTNNLTPDNIHIVANHVYMFGGTPSGGSNSTYYMLTRNSASSFVTSESGLTVFKATGDTNFPLYMRILTNVTAPTGKWWPQIFDLTQMFGSTIADYLYTLESSTAGSGIALLKSWGYFTKPYYAYDAGSLLSVNTSAHETVGFNQWDEEWEAYGSVQIKSKNRIHLIAGATYYAKAPSSGITLYFKENIDDATSIGSITVVNNTFVVPATANYAVMYTGAGYGNVYNHDICINLSCSRNGEYQPYVKRTYALDSDLTLRGIPKLDSNNKLYYDGDTYEADGTVTRRYGIVDLGTLTWTYNSDSAFFKAAVTGKLYGNTNIVCGKYTVSSSATVGGMADKEIKGYPSNTDYDRNAIYVKDSAYTDAATFKTAMSGVYLVYELVTPTTETADPYQTPQILDPNGTEAYIDSRTVPIPVGHETFYPENLRSKVEGLPKNFSTLIAPTEQTYKATQNYTSGALFIVNNILYKATANIANGGTITPGTNCDATTLAAVIAALA